MKQLIGKQIDDVFINDGKDELVFLSGGRYYRYWAEPDCCSDSWIEHVSGVNNLKGDSIKKLRNIEIGEVLPTRQQKDILYGIECTLQKYQWGTFCLEYRNSSNGYYGSRWSYEGYTEDLPDGFSQLSEDF